MTIMEAKGCSIPTSFASVFLFSTALLCICFFSFLSLHPQQHHGFHGFKLLKLTTMAEDDDEGDASRSPPVHFSRQERIAWFKQGLPRFHALESTPKTRMFHKRILEFFGDHNEGGFGQDESRNKCDVRFFMTWISPASKFGSRELLSLESVLKSHPSGCVVLVSRTMDSKLGRKILTPLLDRGFRVLPVAPDIPVLFNNTPAQAWLEGLKEGRIDPGTIPITQNLSNLLRLVVLFKYGGVYLDADLIILTDISSLRNSIGTQSMNATTGTWRTLNNAVMIFNKGHPLLLKFIEEFATNFNGNWWGYNGPLLVSRVAKRVANDSNFEFNALSPVAFYPVDWIRINGLFKQPKGKNETKWARDTLLHLSRNSYGVHLWNKFSKKLRVEEGSVLGRLISDHCIICQNIYGSEGPKHHMRQL